MSPPYSLLESTTIHRSAFLRTLTAPLIAWGATVVIVSARGYPGVVCITPLAWGWALWAGARYIQLSGRQPGLRGPALVGASLGLGMGLLFIVVTALTMPVKAEEMVNALALMGCIALAGMLVCAVLSTLTAWLTLRRHARYQ